MPDTGERSVRFASKQVKAAATPEASDVPALPADWSRYPRTFHRSPEDKRRAGDCDVWILQSAYRQVFDHLAHDTQREHGGLLLGFKTETPTGLALVIAHSLPAHHTIGTPVRLEIQENSWAEWDRIEKSTLRSGLRRVGWYHSHPGIRIFLSRWDLDVCRAFERPTDIAMVVDPIGRQGGFFVCGEEGYRDDSPQSFYEIHNVFSGSVIDWSNAIAEKVAPEPGRTVELAASVEMAPELGRIPERAASVEPVAPVRVSEKISEIRPERREAPPTDSRVRKSRITMNLTVLPLLWLVLLSNFVLAWVVWRRIPKQTVDLQALAREVEGMRADVSALKQLPPVPAASKTSAQSPNSSAASAATAPREPVQSSNPLATPSAPKPPVQPANAAVAAAKWRLDKGPPTLKPSEKYHFKTNGNPPQDLVWSVTPTVGSIDNTGLYTAPAEYSGSVELTVRAASRADPGDAQSAKVTLKGTATKKGASANDKAAPAGEKAAHPSEAEGGAVTIIPAQATLEPSKTLKLIAQVQGAGDQTVKWSIEPAEAGAIDQGGFYTAPADPQTSEVSVTATSRNGKSKTVKINLKLTPKAAPQ